MNKYPFFFFHKILRSSTCDISFIQVLHHWNFSLMGDANTFNRDKIFTTLCSITYYMLIYVNMRPTFLLVHFIVFSIQLWHSQIYLALNKGGIVLRVDKMIRNEIGEWRRKLERERKLKWTELLNFIPLYQSVNSNFQWNRLYSIVCYISFLIISIIFAFNFWFLQ